MEPQKEHEMVPFEQINELLERNEIDLVNRNPCTYTQIIELGIESINGSPSNVQSA